MPTSIASRPQTRLARIVEIIVVFAVPIALYATAMPWAANRPLAMQGVAWAANLLMIALIGLSLRRRGQRWRHIGLRREFLSIRTVLLSFAVAIGAVFAFVLGSILMGMIMGVPEGADMSGFGYLRGNLPMLLLALAAVFIASSFGEEVIYRGYLITRIAELGGDERRWRWMAVVVSALVFGLIHFTWGAMGMVQTGMMGLALGIAFLVLKRNLWALVFAHAYMDAILLIQMYGASGS